MAARRAEVAELIRRVLSGDRVKGAKLELVAQGGPAVEPVLAAATGAHGPTSPGGERETLRHLTEVLERIAARSPRPLAAALAHGVPGMNLAVWALGHSRSAHARTVLKGLVDHEDGGVRAVARYHLERASKRRPAARARKA